MSTEQSRIAGTLTDIDPHVDADLLWTEHAKDQWDGRGGEVGYLRAWEQSEEIDYPSAYDGARGRYHEPSDCVLIVVRERQRHDALGWRIVDIVRTVIKLTDRVDIPVQKDGVDCDEATYVRRQVREEQ